MGTNMWNVEYGMDADSIFLSHHGILGQKWGVRRTPEQLGHGSKAMEKVVKAKNHFIRSSGSRSSSTLSKARKEDVNKLSNQQLKEYNERLNLERNFADLTKGNVGKAKDWVAKTVVTGIVVGSISAVTKQVAQSWLKTQFGIG